MLLRANSLMKGASGIRLEIVGALCGLPQCRRASACASSAARSAHRATLCRCPTSRGAVLGPLPRISRSKWGWRGSRFHTALDRMGLKPPGAWSEGGISRLNNGTGGLDRHRGELGCPGARPDRADHRDPRALRAGGMLRHRPELRALHPRHEAASGPGLDRAGNGEAAVGFEDHPLGKPAAKRGHRIGKLVQDRYSLRCMPQFMGPIVDGLATGVAPDRGRGQLAPTTIRSSIPTPARSCHTGNFLAQYTGVAMDFAALFDRPDGQACPTRRSRLFPGSRRHSSYGLNPSLVGNMEGRHQSSASTVPCTIGGQPDDAAHLLLRPVGGGPFSDPCRPVQPEHQQPGDATPPIWRARASTSWSTICRWRCWSASRRWSCARN